MIENQILSKVLEEKNIDILIEQNIEAKYFVAYTNEAIFIYNHFRDYQQVPTKETFLSNFPNFDLTDTSEDWKYLIDGIREGYTFNQISTMITDSVGVIQMNAFEGMQLIKTKLAELENIKPMESHDLIKNADIRLNEYNERMNVDGNNVIKIGLKEMDEKLFGWNMGEELVTIMARTNQGKSWLLLEFLMNAWKQGKRVGLYSGEMSSTQLGYRFDALYKHFSNLNLMRADPEEKEEYEKYIDMLKKNENCFQVITPKDLGRLANVNDIEFMITKYNLDIVGIDQFSLMDDHRSKKGDPLRARLGNISADLFNLSMKYKIPVIALSQANRQAGKGMTPELEHMSESDAIAQNSTMVISMSRDNDELKMAVVKNRYGKVGDEFIYLWDIDTGKFTFSKYGSKDSDEEEDSKGISRRKVSQEDSPF